MNILIGANRLFLITISLLGAFWAVITLQDVGINIPLLREVLGFLLLTFVPGLLIISAFRLKSETIGETILYSVGLSIFLLTLMILFMSLLYPLIGVTKVLDPVFFMLNLTIILPIFLGYIYLRERNLRANNHLLQPSSKLFEKEINVFKLVSHGPFPLLAILLPLISVLAAFMMNYYGNNTLMFLLLFSLAIVPIIALAKNVPNSHYPMILFAISFAILLRNNLITDYVIGADIQVTYFFSNLIKSNLLWSPEIPGHNLLPTVSAVPAIYSLILNIDLHLVFKIIYSFVYSLAPVGIFYAFNKSFGNKEAFLAGIFFSFFWRFYHDTPGKEAIAHLFLILFLMLITNTTTKKPTRAFFAIVFLFSLAVSHYGTSYIFLIVMALAYFTLVYIRQPKPDNLFSLNLIMLFCVISIGWNLFLGHGGIFAGIVVIASHFGEEIARMFYIDPRTGLYLITYQHPMLKTINLLIYMIFASFIGLGILKSAMNILRRKHENTTRLVLDAIAIPFFLFFSSSIFMFGTHFGIDRAYYLSLVVLSPYTFSGYKLVIQSSSWILKRWREKGKSQGSPIDPSRETQISRTQKFNLLPIAILLAVLLLFDTGLIYQIAGSPVSSGFALNKEANALAYSESEMAGAKWLSETVVQGYIIYPDWNSKFLLYQFFPPRFSDIDVLSLRPDPFSDRLLNLTDLHERSIIYIRSRSISDTHPGDPTYLSTLKVYEITRGASKIYDNGGSKIFIREGRRLE
jgi:uncharacterized membrane protein